MENTWREGAGQTALKALVRYLKFQQFDSNPCNFLIETKVYMCASVNIVIELVDF